MIKKPTMRLISKTDIVKSEDVMQDFEWYFIDTKQLQKRIEWLKEEIPLMKFDVPDVLKKIDEAFEELK